MDIEEVRDKIIKIIESISIDFDKEMLMNSNNIYEDMNWDSLMFVQMLTDIEEEFAIIIPDELLSMNVFSSFPKIVEIVCDNLM